MQQNETLYILNLSYDTALRSTMSKLIEDIKLSFIMLHSTIYSTKEKKMMK